MRIVLINVINAIASLSFWFDEICLAKTFYMTLVPPIVTDNVRQSDIKLILIND